MRQPLFEADETYRPQPKRTTENCCRLAQRVYLYRIAGVRNQTTSNCGIRPEEKVVVYVFQCRSDELFLLQYITLQVICFHLLIIISRGVARDDIGGIYTAISVAAMLLESCCKSCLGLLAPVHQRCERLAHRSGWVVPQAASDKVIR